MLRAAPRARRSHWPQVEVSELAVPGSTGPMPSLFYSPPAEDRPTPLIVFFHGGGFVTCSPRTHDELCRLLAARSGARVLSVGYTLAPELAFPGQVEQALEACRWARDNAEVLGADASRLGVAGDSAGAYLAALSALRLNREQARSISLQLLLYPLIHLEDALWRAPMGRHFRPVGRIAVHVIRRQGGAPLGSLLDENLTHAPPSLVVSGGPDPTAPDAREFAARLKASGVAVSEHRFPLLPHGGFNFTHLSAGAGKALSKVARESGEMLRG